MRSGVISVSRAGEITCINDNALRILQIAGAPEGWDRIVTRGALDGGKFIAFAMKGAKVVGATVVNMGREMRFVKSLVQTAKDVNDADLANEGQQLRALAG